MKNISEIQELLEEIKDRILKIAYAIFHLKKWSASPHPVLKIAYAIFH